MVSASRSNRRLGCCARSQRCRLESDLVRPRFPRSHYCYRCYRRRCSSSSVTTTSSATTATTATLVFSAMSLLLAEVIPEYFAPLIDAGVMISFLEGIVDSFSIGIELLAEVVVVLRVQCLVKSSVRRAGLRMAGIAGCVWRKSFNRLDIVFSASGSDLKSSSPCL